MRWFKHTISVLLLLVAVGVVLSTALSDHSDDYGQVSLPQGGTVHLPEGKVTVYYRVDGDSSELDHNAGGLVFRVTPAEGGEPIPMKMANGQTSGVAVTRSETIGELGAVAKLDVPAAGDYVVSGNSSLPPDTSHLDLGTNAGAALLAKWKLIAGLVVGALLLGLIPVPRSGRRWEDPADEPTGWSPARRAPYAGWPVPLAGERAAPSAPPEARSPAAGRGAGRGARRRREATPPGRGIDGPGARSRSGRPPIPRILRATFALLSGSSPVAVGTRAGRAPDPAPAARHPPGRPARAAFGGGPAARRRLARGAPGTRRRCRTRSSPRGPMNPRRRRQPRRAGVRAWAPRCHGDRRSREWGCRSRARSGR